jgi:hypothetical protein
MEGTRQAPTASNPDRHFRDQSGTEADSSVEVGFRADGPLEVNMTDEPGGDPYNHTGRFKRLYR